MKSVIHNFSQWLSRSTGSPMAFLLAALGVIVWLITGPYFHFSNTWMIAISTITDVIIFLMIFTLQSSQYRDSKAIQLKLNELIAADRRARDSFIGLEEMTDEELEELDKEFQKLLVDLERPEILHKLHHTIKEAKAKRPSFYKQAENILDHIIKGSS